MQHYESGNQSFVLFGIKYIRKIVKLALEPVYKIQRKFMSLTFIGCLAASIKVNPFYLELLNRAKNIPMGLKTYKHGVLAYTYYTYIH